MRFFWKLINFRILKPKHILSHLLSTKPMQIHWCFYWKSKEWILRHSAISELNSVILFIFHHHINFNYNESWLRLIFKNYYRKKWCEEVYGLVKSVLQNIYFLWLSKIYSFFNKGHNNWSFFIRVSQRKFKIKITNKLKQKYCNPR